MSGQAHIKALLRSRRHFPSSPTFPRFVLALSIVSARLVSLDDDKPRRRRPLAVADGDVERTFQPADAPSGGKGERSAFLRDKTGRRRANDVKGGSLAGRHDWSSSQSAQPEGYDISTSPVTTAADYSVLRAGAWTPLEMPLRSA